MTWKFWRLGPAVPIPRPDEAAKAYNEQQKVKAEQEQHWIQDRIEELRVRVSVQQAERLHARPDRS